MHYAPVRYSYKNIITNIRIGVQLACVKHVTSVHTEPGSNPLQQINPKDLTYVFTYLAILSNKNLNIKNLISVFRENIMFHNSFKQI